MLTSVYNIINGCIRMQRTSTMLNRLKDGKKVNVDLSVMLGNVNGAFIDSFQALKELEIAEKIDSPCVRFLPGMLKMTYDQFVKLRTDKTEDPLAYLPVVDQFISLTKEVDEDSYLKYNVGGYSFTSSTYKSNWIFSGYALSSNIIQSVLDRVQPITREINVLNIDDRDQCSGMIQVKERLNKAKLYAIDASTPHIGEDTMGQMERLIAGGLKGAKVSNDSFDLVFATPKLSVERPDDTSKLFKSDERYMFDRAYDFLRKGGVMVYALPDTHISSEMAMTIAKQLADIQVIQDVENPGTYVIMGRKPMPIDRVLDAHVFSLLRSLIMTPELVDTVEEKKFTLPASSVTVKMFHGSRLTDVEINSLFNGSPAMNEFWESQKVAKISDKSAHPLLPFSIGQLGLVLTSGCLDGVVEEGDGCSHVIKGRVVKITDSSSSYNDDNSNIQISDTVSNRVEISMFLPDGTYKCLA